MKDWWNGTLVWHPPGQRFHLKLKAVRDALQIWNRDVFGRADQRKYQILEEILKWDSKEEEKGLQQEERLEREELCLDYERVLEMEEIMWR